MSFHAGLSADVVSGRLTFWTTKGSLETDKMFTQLAADTKEKGMDLPLLTPAESAAAQIKIIDELTIERAGLFLNYTGEERG